MRCNNNSLSEMQHTLQLSKLTLFAESQAMAIQVIIVYTFRNIEPFSLFSLPPKHHKGSTHMDTITMSSTKMKEMYARCGGKIGRQQIKTMNF